LVTISAKEDLRLGVCTTFTISQRNDVLTYESKGEFTVGKSRRPQSEKIESRGKRIHKKAVRWMKCKGCVFVS